MPYAYKPLHEYPYRYAPPIGVTEVSYPSRGAAPLTRSLVPDAAAVRYNVGGFNPGVPVGCYARPKDLRVLSLQPFDLAIPGLEPLPVDATLPTVRREFHADFHDLDFDDEDDWEDDYEARPRRRGSFQGSAPAAQAAPAAQPKAGKPFATAVQNITAIPGQIIDVAARGASEARELRRVRAAPASSTQISVPAAAPSRDTETLKLVTVGLVGLVGGVVIGTMLARRS